MKRFRLIIAAALALALAACLPAVSPSWSRYHAFLKGAGNDRAFYGSGTYKDATESLARTAAENRARNQLGKILQRFTTALVAEYKKQGRTMADEGLPHDVLIATMSNSELVEYWRNPDSRIPAISVLAKTDLSAYIANMEQVKGLDADFRKFVRENAGAIFDRFRAEGDSNNWQK